MRDDSKDPQATIRGVAAIIARHSAEEWTARFAGQDVCANIVRTLDEAMREPQFGDRGLFRRSVVGGDQEGLPAVSVPICENLRDPRTELRYPRLGDSNELLPGS